MNLRKLDTGFYALDAHLMRSNSAVCDGSWIARIVGRDPKYTLAREFVSREKHQSRSMSIAHLTHQACGSSLETINGGGNTIVKNALDYLSVVGSSMEAQRRAMDIRVAADEDIFVLSDGYGNEIRLEEDNAMRLYQDLAARLGMPHQVNCPHCDDPMMDYEQCSCIQSGV